MTEEASKTGEPKRLEKDQLEKYHGYAMDYLHKFDQLTEGNPVLSLISGEIKDTNTFEGVEKDLGSGNAVFSFYEQSGIDATNREITYYWNQPGKDDQIVDFKIQIPTKNIFITGQVTEDGKMEAEISENNKVTHNVNFTKTN